MRVLIDTNVLISAALYPNSVPFQAYVKATTHPYQGLICKQNVDEMRRVFNRKFPCHLQSLEKFLSLALLTLELVEIPEEKYVLEKKIRDIKDRPILRAAIHAKADIILTGDKDFLESSIKSPLVLTPIDFINVH